MASLARHLRQPGTHDHLPFHPGCPACRRARTNRAITGVPVLTSRLRVGITAAVLGAATLAATVRGAGPAAAQTTTAPSDMAPKKVTPDQLGKHLADPNRPDPTSAKPATPDVHVVQPGDNLWTIARQELGGSGRPSNARIATEVNRLWSINAKSVATGNRNLIYPGQHIKLK